MGTLVRSRQVVMGRVCKRVTTALIIFAISLPAHATLYSIISLGALDGNDSAWENVIPSDINDQGEVVGAISTPGPGSYWFSFLWRQANGMQNLGTFGGNSTANAINNNSSVVGSSGADPFNAGSNHRAYSWNSADGMRDLGTLGGFTSQANSINSLGMVVGKSTSPFSEHAFIWRVESGMLDLGTLGGSWSEAQGVNDSGQVVGISRTSGINAHAFLWDDINGMVDLGSLGDSSSAVSINNGGVAVGFYFINSLLRAFVWDEFNGMSDLGSLGGGSAVAHDINDQGQIVGASRSQDNISRATIWDAANGWMDLNDLVIGASGWELTDAAAINARGQVVGSGWKNGLYRSFLLTPLSVPEPSIFSLFAIGLSGLCFRKQKASGRQSKPRNCLWHT